MECEKVRDRFSSLLEGELNPSEEKAIRDHLAFCSECQKDFEKFEKTLLWLHSVEEAEVPDGFLSEIHKKMEDQRNMGVTAGKARPGWFNTLVQLKLPVQAVAMVAIVFLVLYVTKIVPVETPHLMKEEVEQKKAPQSEVKEEAKLVPKEAEKEKGTTKLPSEMSQEKKIDRMVVAKVEEEAKSATAYIPKAEAPGVEAPQPKATEKGKGPPSEPGKIEKMVMAQHRAYLAAKLPEEIILKIADREKVLSQLHELVKQFGGEIVKQEGNILLASLPAASFSEFEKELAELSSLTKSDAVVPQKGAAESKGTSPGVKRKEAEEKEKKPPKALTDKERRVSIRILLIQE
jgi:anti-sigma factor RsiW